MCLPSLFIQTIVEVNRNNTRKQRLYFPVSILRILDCLECPSSSVFVHQTAPLGATFLNQRNAQKKTVEPSEGTGKRTS